MDEGPSSTDGQLTIRWRNPLPAKPGGRATSAERPYMDCWAILAKCPKGGPQWPPPQGQFSIFVLAFFMCSPCGLATKNQTSQTMNGRATRNRRRKVRKKAGRPWEDIPTGRSRKCPQRENPQTKARKPSCQRTRKIRQWVVPGRRIWPRMADGPSSTTGQLTVRWRNPLPVSPRGRSTSATTQI